MFPACESSAALCKYSGVQIWADDRRENAVRAVYGLDSRTWLVNPATKGRRCLVRSTTSVGVFETGCRVSTCPDAGSGTTTDSQQLQHVGHDF
eukprot:351893-Chlamydomonas_euryale.AAC.2